MNRTAPTKSIVAEPVQRGRFAQFFYGRGLLYVLLALTVIGVAPVAPALWRYAATNEFRLHAPNWELFAALAPMIKLHIIAAMTALLIGIVVWLRPKGVGLHKFLGWSWVTAMAVTAGSSLFIMELNRGFFSFIHLFAGWVLVALPMAVFAIRRKDVKTHSRNMRNLFIGGLLIAGAFSFIPGRIMFQLFFG